MTWHGMTWDPGNGFPGTGQAGSGVDPDWADLGKLIRVPGGYRVLHIWPKCAKKM